MITAVGLNSWPAGLLRFEAVAHAGFGDEVTWPGGVGLQLAAQ
jgi:hypothetical protein